MQIRGEQVFLEIIEGKDQAPHVLTKKELQEFERYEKEKTRYSFVQKPKVRKYDYIANGKLRVMPCRNCYIRDTNSSGIENRLGEILLMLYIQSNHVRIAREEREKAQRKAEEESRKRELFRQRYNEEVDTFQALCNEANDFDMACKIRVYVAAVEQKKELNESTSAWLAWANAKADWLDPTIAAEDAIFGKRKHAAEQREKDPAKRWW